MTAEIIELTNLGILRLRFLSESAVDDNLMRQVVENNTEIFVQPRDYRDSVEGFNKTSLALKWRIIRTHDKMMEIQIVFQDPIQISPSI